MDRKDGSRRKFDRAFKLEAVRLSEEEGCNIAALARRLGIRTKLLYRWREALKTSGENAFPGKGRCPAEAEELRRLRREKAVLQEERDILKKALSIFSAAGR